MSDTEINREGTAITCERKGGRKEGVIGGRKEEQNRKKIRKTKGWKTREM